MIRTNKDELVTLGITATVAHPKLNAVTGVTSEGIPEISIGMAGIVYNVRVGDPAFGYQGDHIEPALSIAHPNMEVDYALHYLMCVGNDARVVSGFAKGEKGIVTGEHARIMVDVDPEAMKKMKIGDKVLVKAQGRGLKLLDHPGILVKKSSPRLIEKWGLTDLGNGRLQVPVTKIMPSSILGSGAELEPEFVDQDMMTGDREYLAETGFDQLRLGDLVAVMDTNHMYHRGYCPGGVTIGLIMHGDSLKTGHGPGVQDMLVCAHGEIEPVIDPNANIAKIFNIR